MNRITASCRISAHSIYRNGEPVFENSGTDLAGFLLTAYQHFTWNYPKFYKMDNLSKLGWMAAELLLKEALPAGHYRPEEIGVVLANANASLDTDLKYYETAKDIPSPALFVYTLPNIMIGEICIRHHIKGESAFFIADRFDAGFIERTVNYLLDHDILQACITGWVDLLQEEYNAVLYLVEKDVRSGGLDFTATTIHKIFQGEYE